jgi:monomeric sarcosine oxidase
VSDVLVAGAGVLGAFAALALQERGLRVTLCDPWEPGHPRATSSSESRVIRAIYGKDRLYAEWSWNALKLWERFEQESGARVFFRTGVLWLSSGEDGYAEAGLATLKDLGIPAERLEPSEVARRFPAVSGDGLRFGVVEPAMGALLARHAVRTAVQLFERKGGRVLRGPARLATNTPDGKVSAIEVAGNSVAADAFVFACGPWLPQLFPDLPAGFVRSFRAEELYFGVPTGSRDFDADRLPTWVEIGQYYGIPALDGRGFKVGIDRPGEELDPSTSPRLLDPATIATVRGFLARRFPGLADAPLVDSRVCTYELTPDEHLLVDRHPRHSNVILLGGGSGHAFKLAPVLGGYVADLATGARAATEPRFQIGERSARGWREP